MNTKDSLAIKPPEHLKAYYASRKQSTSVLIEKAIAKLKREKKRISFASIREAAYEIDGSRKLSESTIARNPDAYRMYLAASGNLPKPRSPSMRWLLRDIPEADRESEAKELQKLRRKSKADLVMHVRRGIREIRKLESELKVLRSEILDKAAPAGIRTLRPVLGK